MPTLRLPGEVEYAPRTRKATRAGAVRAVLGAVGVQDALTKSLGSANGFNMVKATLNALSKLRSAGQLAKMRGKTIKEVVKGA